jgi:hypothetical protein
MPSLQLENLGWIEAGFGPDEERATTASLRIVAGDLPSLEFTKVEDRIAQSLRSHINVPLAPLALWLVMNWWRLRFEGKPDVPTIRWFQAHRLSSIGGDHAWPPLDIYSDKDFIRLEMDAEAAFDAAAVRYLQPVSLDVPADDFETAVDALLDHVDARLAATLPAYTRLRELRAELAEERLRDSNARVCRWQAMAGLDPGNASERWITEATALVEEVGAVAGDEIMSVLPGFDGRIASVRRVVDEMKCSPTAIDLSRVVPHAIPRRGLPWQQGVELAGRLRRAQGLERGPLTNEKLSDLVGVRLPLPGGASRPPLGGGDPQRSARRSRSDYHEADACREPAILPCAHHRCRACAPRRAAPSPRHDRAHLASEVAARVRTGAALSVGGPRRIHR